MSNPWKACNLYQNLLESLPQGLVARVPAGHSRLLAWQRESRHYYQTMYLDEAQGVPALKRPGDAVCRECEKFHLSTLKQIDKNPDIDLGNELEAVFEAYFQQVLDTLVPGLVIERADQQELHMPDFQVRHVQSGEVLLLMEFKVIFRPFLRISQKVNPAYECYSHSMTLDVAGKLNAQRELVVNGPGARKCAYVYWYDLPCVKGVFWMSAEDVYRHQDEQVAYKRKVVSGDMGSAGQVRGAVRKLYLPLYQMNDFDSLVSLLQESVPLK
ncbi:hypothetical protein NOX82_11085 [Pseudomonas citronellolis]|uniref:hypothetical protein n=1 Tax=Pseudomonas citronellolis TaxID=53408 RepID=UPI0021111403|nr:hypothetical protein [Pseudomonas citronellolis]UUC52423.1 hypothetical protein NOX82_11085 [Pseudomonas citronellolis]